MAATDDFRRVELAAKSDELQPTAVASAKSANMNRSAPGGPVDFGRGCLALFVVGDARSCRGPSDVHLAEVRLHPYRFGRRTMRLNKKLCGKLCERRVSSAFDDNGAVSQRAIGPFRSITGRDVA